MIARDNNSPPLWFDPDLSGFRSEYGTQHLSARLCYYIPRILSLTKDTNGLGDDPNKNPFALLS
jgi:hypothetical protein